MIELNPVRARMTDDPVAWRWSSCAADPGLRPQSGLTRHPARAPAAQAHLTR
jgi:putative transposase